MTVALVPAGGHSTRMGRPKLSLTVNGRAVIQRVVDCLLAGGVSQVLVVVGPHVPEVGGLAMAAGAEVLTLAEPTPDMRATVERGLKWIEERDRPRPDDWWLLAPADRPETSAAMVRHLLTEGTGNTPHSVVVPIHDGRRGHPILVRWRHVYGIRAMPAGEGINTYLKRLVDETLEMPVDDPGILMDMDTPEDYRRLTSAENQK